MASNYIPPLNLKYIFQNLLAGSPEIFMGLFFVVACILAGVFKMPGKAFLMIMALSGMILYDWFGGGFYIIIVLLGGIIIFWRVSKIVKN